MKHISTVFLKGAVVLIAVIVLAAIIKFPQTEGRAKDLDLVRIYTDPFIIYGYIASIPFFVALYQVFKLLGLFDKNKIFSKAAGNAVRTIKYCATITVGFIIGAEVFILLNAKNDDPAGAVAMGIFLTFISVVVIVATAIFERILAKRLKA